MTMASLGTDDQFRQSIVLSEMELSVGLDGSCKHTTWLVALLSGKTWLWMSWKRHKMGANLGIVRWFIICLTGVGFGWAYGIDCQACQEPKTDIAFPKSHSRCNSRYPVQSAWSSTRIIEEYQAKESRWCAKPLEKPVDTLQIESNVNKKMVLRGNQNEIVERQLGMKRSIMQ